MSRILQSFCVGHTVPLFEPQIPYTMLCPKPLGLAQERVLYDDRFGPGVDGGSLAEYSQLFGLQELLMAGDIVADDLYLFQYRKFVSPVAGGLESVSPWIRVLPRGATHGIAPTPQTLETFATRISVGSFQQLGESIPANYARVHVAEDMAMFSAACVSSGALSAEDIRVFATTQGIIPSPALCYIHTDLFVRTMCILQTVWTEHCRHYHIHRTGYQRRVAGYLLERLHSFLLCKWLVDQSEPDIKIWHRYVINEEL
jgi:hypothetical protein